MKYQSDAYAESLAELLEEKPQQKDEFIKNLKIVLKRNGDFGLFIKILKQATGLLIRKSGGREIVIQSARPLFKKQLEELKQQFRAQDSVETVVNPDLIAGVKIMIDNDQIIDGSLERKLRKLFK